MSNERPDSGVCREPTGELGHHRLEEENRRLKRAVEELSVLNDLSREIGASIDSQKIMQIIIDRSLLAIGAEQGTVTLVDQEAQQPAETVVRAVAATSMRPMFHLDQALLGWMLINKRPLVSQAPETDERLHGTTFDPSIQSLLSVPLLVKSELKALLTVYNKKGKAFTPEDERLLAIIAAQSAQVMENARLYEKELALQRMRQEVELAARIQSQLLPEDTPNVPGYEIIGTTAAARQVGGDYFDFIWIDDRQLAVCLGDVSGKGLPASILMANLQATFRGQTFPGCVPSDSVERANRLLCRCTDADQFVTMFFGILDLEHDRFTYCNAGHNPPLLLAGGGESSLLETGGLILGALASATYSEASISLQPGDLLAIYSDGITEARDGHDEELGERRLFQLLEQHRHEPAADIADKVIATVHEHSSEVRQTDDMTLVLVKRSGEED